MVRGRPSAALRAGLAAAAAGLAAGQAASSAVILAAWSFETSANPQYCGVTSVALGVSAGYLYGGTGRTEVPFTCVLANPTTYACPTNSAAAPQACTHNNAYGTTTTAFTAGGTGLNAFALYGTPTPSVDFVLTTSNTTAASECWTGLTVVFQYTQPSAAGATAVAVSGASFAGTLAGGTTGAWAPLSPAAAPPALCGGAPDCGGGGSGGTGAAGWTTYRSTAGAALPNLCGGGGGVAVRVAGSGVSTSAGPAYAYNSGLLLDNVIVYGIPSTPGGGVVTPPVVPVVPQTLLSAWSFEATPAWSGVTQAFTGVVSGFLQGAGGGNTLVPLPYTDADPTTYACPPVTAALGVQACGHNNAYGTTTTLFNPGGTALNCLAVYGTQAPAIDFALTLTGTTACWTNLTLAFSYTLPSPGGSPNVVASASAFTGSPVTGGAGGTAAGYTRLTPAPAAPVLCQGSPDCGEDGSGTAARGWTAYRSAISASVPQLCGGGPGVTFRIAGFAVPAAAPPWQYNQGLLLDNVVVFGSAVPVPPSNSTPGGGGGGTTPGGGGTGGGVVVAPPLPPVLMSRVRVVVTLGNLLPADVAAPNTLAGVVAAVTGFIGRATFVSVQQVAFLNATAAAARRRAAAPGGGGARAAQSAALGLAFSFTLSLYATDSPAAAVGRSLTGYAAAPPPNEPLVPSVSALVGKIVTLRGAVADGVETVGSGPGGAAAAVANGGADASAVGGGVAAVVAVAAAAAVYFYCRLREREAQLKKATNALARVEAPVDAARAAHAAYGVGAGAGAGYGSGSPTTSPLADAQRAARVAQVSGRALDAGAAGRSGFEPLGRAA